MKKAYVKYGIVISLVFLIMMAVAGCGYKGIEKRAFVVGVGVDPSKDDKDKFRVTLKIAKPIASLKNTQSNEYVHLVNENDSIAEAIRILSTKDDKTLDFSQMKILVIHEDLFAEEMGTYMDFFTRRGDFQLIMYVMAGKPTAEETLKARPQLESTAENALFNFYDQTGTESPFVTTTFLFNLRKDFKTQGLNAVVPVVSTNDEGDQLQVDHSIVVRDNKDPVELNHTETKIFNTLTQGANGYGYRVEHSDYKMTLTLDRVSMKVDLQTKGPGRKRAVVRVSAVGAISESQAPLSISKLHLYSEAASKEFSGELTALFERMQQEEVDPFGFGLRYRATRLSHSQTFDDWQAIYPELEFDVKVKVKLKAVGSIE